MESRPEEGHGVGDSARVPGQVIDPLATGGRPGASPVIASLELSRADARLSLEPFIADGYTVHVHRTDGSDRVIQCLDDLPTHARGIVVIRVARR